MTRRTGFGSTIRLFVEDGVRGMESGLLGVRVVMERVSVGVVPVGRGKWVQSSLLLPER